jgi:hypothetical protein
MINLGKKNMDKQNTLFGVEMKEEIVEEEKPIRRNKKAKVNLPLIEVPYVIEPHLLKWKLFLENLCKEHNETALIYFNVSAPYDDEVVIHLDSHKYCGFRGGCVSFRFRDGNFVAYDSGFDGGTTSVWKYTNTALDNEEEEIIEIMEKVFSKKCEEDYTTEKEDKQDFEVGEDFWIIDDYTIERRLKKITDRKKILELQETLKKFKEDEEKKEAEEKRLVDLTIDDDFIYREDLHEWRFKEDEFGRYRERIWDRTKKIGTAIWFENIGFPISPDSIYKNRYTGDLITLKEEVFHCCCVSEKEEPFDKILQSHGFLTWESWLPLEKWNDKNLFLEYKEGTPEYLKKKEDEEKEKNKSKRIKPKPKVVEKENDEMFGAKIPPSLESKPKKKDWEFEDLGIEGETDYITYVNFEAENERGFEMFKTKKVLNGYLKTKQIKKGEIEKKLVCVVQNCSLEGICVDYEEVFNNEKEIKDFILTTKNNSDFAIKKNKENIFFDTRRYFWKYENKELKNIGWDCSNEQERKEQNLEFEKREKEKEEINKQEILKNQNEAEKLESDIKQHSSILKELLKNKYGYSVKIQVLKEETK